MVWMLSLSRFVALTYVAYVLGALIWFFAFGDGNVKQLRSFMPAMVVSMVAVVPSVLVWLVALLLAQTRDGSLSSFMHVVLAVVSSFLIVAMMGAWIWFENSRTTSLLGQSIMKSFLWPSLVFAVMSAPCAWIFAKHSEVLKLGKLFP